MPNPTLLDTDAMKYAEIGRRADLSKIPIQFAQSMGAGLNAAKTVEDIQNDRAKREKAAEFEKILQGGLPTMKQAWQELGPDGQKKVPDPALFTDSREATASWWQLAVEVDGKRREAEGQRQFAEQAAGKPFNERVATAQKVGVLSAKDALNMERPSRNAAIAHAGLSEEMSANLDRGMTAIEDQEREDGAILSDAERQRILRAHGMPAAMLGNKIVEAVWKTGVAGESLEQKRKTKVAEGNKETELAIRQDEIKDRREQRVIDEAQSFAKDTDNIAKTTTAIKRIHDILEEVGVTGGLFTEDTSKIPGYGTGTKLWRDWINDPATVKLRQAVNILVMNKRKETAGSAVTPQEAAVLEKTLGVNNRSNAQAFIESLRNFASENKVQLQAFEAGISDKAKKRIKERGGVTSDDVPVPKPKGGAPAAADAPVDKKAEDLRKKYSY